MENCLLRAYLDDYQKIEVIIDKNFCQGKSEVFYLLDGREALPLTLVDKTEEAKCFKYEVSCENDVVIGHDYEIMIVNGFRCPLQYRFVVKTQRFEDEFYYDGDDLGSTLTDKYTKFALWAPTASQVRIEIEYGEKTKIVDMRRTENGVYRLTIAPRCIGAIYRYFVKVNGNWNETIDPYGKASLPNGSRSVVVDLGEYKVEKLHMPELWRYSDAVIYETSVRDYSEEGTFAAMKDKLGYLKNLGITSLQLMPVNDFGSVDELHKDLFYNWGYDPVQYFALEGSYSSDVNNPTQILRDFRDLVTEAHNQRIRINLDVVFNHLYYLNTSTFNKVVPYYYFRYDEKRNLSNGSFCGNDVDSNRKMVRKLIIDALKYFVNEFDVDGFRFDLMGILDVETINSAYAALKELKSDVMLYGEGWNMNTAIAEEDRACSLNHEQMPSIAFFNDVFRDTIKGSTFDAKLKGFGTGKKNLTEEAADLMRGTTYGKAEQSVNYVECHDDMTVFDKLAICCKDESEEKRIERTKLLLGMVILAQGIPFIHSGQEYCRSKNGYVNTYNMGDEINKLKDSDKEKYADVVDTVRTLINIRRKYRINKKEDCIDSDVTTEIRNGVLIYRVANCNGETEITAIINPTDKTFDYYFDGFKTLLYGSKRKAGMVGTLVECSPVSVTVLGSSEND